MQIYSWDKVGFESAYWKQYYKQKGCGAARAHNCQCSEIDITYSRLFFEDDKLFKVRAENIVNKLQLQESTDIFVVGCALGFLMEELRNMGMNVWGCDNSHFIHTIKNKEKARTPIHNISILDADFTNKVRNATGAMWFDVIITEDLLTSHDSYTEIFNNCESILNPNKTKTNIVHLVDTNTKTPFMSKPLNKWKELNTNYTWLNTLGEE
jgi:2-polyprenyl-3-methyl-5-hydroxy-6-metoxy-1,4-benzoquinol methylase